MLKYYLKPWWVHDACVTPAAHGLGISRAALTRAFPFFVELVYKYISIRVTIKSWSDNSFDPHAQEPREKEESSVVGFPEP